MAETIERKEKIERELRAALITKEGLAVHFQPLVTMSGEVSGLEALLRVNFPGVSALSAREVVAISEDSNLAEDLTLFVASKVCDATIAHPNLTIAMYLTATQVMAESFAERLTELVLTRGVEPSRIQLEITESAFDQRSAELIRALASLHQKGFVLSTDDFGTSNASLSYLKRANISIVKFDRTMLLNTREMSAPCQDPRPEGCLRRRQ